MHDITDGLAIQNRLRHSTAHEAFGTETVKLAFGKNQAGRIRHVGDVERGAACSCLCPACAEPLVAKQGRQKAWHFAHASGGSCRDALSAGFAAYLVQLIEEGEEIALPDLEWTWGSSLSRRSIPPFAFESAVMEEPEGKEGYRVRARAPGASRDVIVLFRTGDSLKPALSDQDSSILEIDIARPLGRLLAAGQGAAMNEDWLRRQVLSEAPRCWLRNAASTGVRENLCNERLGAHLRALEALEASGRPDTASPAEERMKTAGHAALLISPTIRGERFLGPTSAGWRAQVLEDLVFSPRCSAGFSDRDIVRFLGRADIVKQPALMRPLPADDALELERRAPDLRKPIDVIRDYLVWLWTQDIVRVRPGLFDAADMRGLIDPRLQGVRMPDWIATSAP